MPIPKMMNPQNDFSAGQLNEDAKRSDDPLVKAGARQLSNWRILNSRKVKERPGRSVLFPAEGRVDDVLLSSNTSGALDFTATFLAEGITATGSAVSGGTFRLCFGPGTLKIRDSNGIYLAGNSGYAWTAATLKDIVWVLVNRSASERDIVMCFPGQRPKIARWSGSGGWSFLDFSFTKSANGAILEPFYRLAPPGLAIKPSAITGVVTVEATDNYFTAGMIGTVIRYIGHQILLTAFTDAKTMAGMVIEQLPVTVDLGTVSGVDGIFNVGDVISSITPTSSNYEGQVAAVTLDGGGVVTSMVVNMFTSGEQFASGDQITGPQGTCTAGSVTVVSPGYSTQWDEEAMNQNRGWPGSVFFDQDRQGFCDLPSVAGAIVWSRIGVYNDFLVGANPDDPIFEIIPNRARVYHVINKSDEFVMTSLGIWYIPISASNPLKPGSVQFLQVSADPVAPVKPTLTTQAIIYLNAALNRVGAILPKQGSLYIPWSTEETSLYHSDLFDGPIAIAATTATGDFQEQYVHVLNADGTMAVGKFDVAKEWAGWLPWNGGGTVNWISSLGEGLMLTTTYTSNGVPVMVAETIDDSQYLDGALAVNSLPPAMRAGSDPAIAMLLVGIAATTMTDHTIAPFAFDGNALKNKVASPGINSAVIGYGNRTLLKPNVGAQKLCRVRVTAPLDAPFSAAGSTTFRIIGSQDAVTWTTLYTSAATAGTNGEQIDVTSGIDQTTAYLYYGIDIFGSAGQAVSIALIEPFYLAPGTVHKAPGGGTGPLWWLASGTADVMDGLMSKGTYPIDADGNLVPIENGEDLTSVTLTAGKAWISILEPFLAHAQGGQDTQQRMRRRKIIRAAVSVQNSTGGFTFCNRRIPPYNAGDDQTQPPPLRETTYMFRPRGRSYDPREPLVKDIPGPLTVLEIGMEATT